MELYEQISDLPDTPFGIGGISRTLIPGEKVNILLEENYLCRNVEVLDYKENPLSEISNLIEIQDPETYQTLTALLTDNKSEEQICVIRYEGMRIWFDRDYACLLEDMEDLKKTNETTEDEQSKRPFYTRPLFWALIFLLIFLWTIFVNN
ncbi:MAG: hypothetical protein AB1333_04710 [Patescibacteria group bacterium]